MSSPYSIPQVQVKPATRSSWTPGGSTQATSTPNSQAIPQGYKYLVGRTAQRKLMRWHIFGICRRLVVIAAAIQYIVVSMTATSRMIQTLKGTPNPPESFRVFTASLISAYLGKGLIRESPLVKIILENDSTPRNHAVFLESKTNTSFHNCSGLPKFNPKIYNYDYLSHAYLEMVDDVKYNATILENSELVAVVVDCSFTNLKSGDAAMVRFFNLVRSRSDPNDLYVVTMSINVQDYEIRDYHKKGPGLLGMISLSRDMSGDTMGEFYIMALTYPYKRSMDFEVYEFVQITTDSNLELRSVPRDPFEEPVKHVVTSRKRGFFDGEEQSNIRYMYTLLDLNATSAQSRWEWLGEAVIADSKAWVHSLHFVFGMQTIFSLLVLCFVSFQNARMGKLWVGDPFASLSTTSIVMRGILVILSWYINSFWMLFEYCLANGGKISKTQIVRIHTELVHADILVVYLSLVGLLSGIFRERIDPSVAIFLFEIIYSYGLTIVDTWSSVIRNEVVKYSDRVFYLGVPKLAASVAEMAPLRLWSTFQIPLSKETTFLFASFFPYAILLSIIAGFAIVHKVYRHYHPDKNRRRSTAMSTERSSISETTALALKGNLTNFEISTGAELQTRFGLISDYNNYVYFKGMKFASADGVYCSGYVIVNGKLLVRVKQLLSIAMIKATGSRFTNVYAYEVEGNTVKQTALLVYPETFTWSDLWHLNVTVLL